MGNSPNSVISQKSYWSILFAVLIGLIAGGLIFLLSQPRPGNPVALLPAPTSAPILIHVSGAVLNPGIYELELGSRAQDALDAAGGSLEDADLDRINLARVLIDGQQIHVPSFDEAEEGFSLPININRASVEQLTLLPGIGPVSAEAIIDYRDLHGPFSNIEEIQNVSGIGPSTFDNIKALIDIQG